MRELVVPRAFAFVGQDILFTGNDPFSAEEISGLLPDYYMDDDVPEDVSFNVVVVGQTDFSEEAITDVIDRDDRGLSSSASPGQVRVSASSGQRPP